MASTNNEIELTKPICTTCSYVEHHFIHCQDYLPGICEKCSVSVDYGSSCCPPNKLCNTCAEEYNSCVKCGNSYPSPAKSARK